jgi:hypothetical protein
MSHQLVWPLRVRVHKRFDSGHVWVSQTNTVKGLSHKHKSLTSENNLLSTKKTLHPKMQLNISPIRYPNPHDPDDKI